MDKYLPNKNERLEAIVIDDTYSFFDSLVGFLSGACSLLLLSDVYNGNPHKYEEGHFVYFEGCAKCTNRIYYFYPNTIFDFVLEKEWPNSLTIAYKEKEFPDAPLSHNRSSYSKIPIMSLGQSMYIQFWESINLEILNKFGKKQNDWPELMRFGWIVRNALAHNNISIDDPNIKPAKCYHLILDQSLNGMLLSNFIMYFELTLLMKDIEDKLRSLS